MHATLTNRTDNALGFFNGTTIASNGVNWHRAIHGVALTENVSYVLTCFYKEGTSGRLRFELRTNSNSSSIIGTIGSLNVTSTAGGALELLSDEAYGDVRKLSAKWTPNYTGSAQIGLGPDSFTSGETVIGYGAQVETGSFPTSYIPTSGSAVTRAADLASLAVSEFGYNQGQGTVVVEAVMPPSVTSEQFWILGSNTNNARWLYSNSGDISLNAYDGASTSSVSPLQPSATQKMAIGTDQSTKILCLDGVSGNPTNTTGNISLLTTVFYFGGNFATPVVNLNGHIKSIQYYPLRLSNAQLQALTV